MIELHTFSIAARCPRSGDVGVAVSTARPAVGALVPWVSCRGAIATQARVSTDLGRHGLALVEQGVPIGLALAGLLQRDGDRELRQLHGVDTRETFVYTGPRCVAWCGHVEGDGFTVAGNMLVGERVVEAIAAAFSATAGEELAERLVRCLEAGQRAGGDKRGAQSAALLVGSGDPRGYHNLRVDDHADPVSELRRVFDLSVAHWARVGREYGPEGQRLFGRIKY